MKFFKFILATLSWCSVQGIIEGSEVRPAEINAALSYMDKLEIRKGLARDEKAFSSKGAANLQSIKEDDTVLLRSRDQTMLEVRKQGLFQAVETNDQALFDFYVERTHTILIRATPENVTLAQAFSVLYRAKDLQVQNFLANNKIKIAPILHKYDVLCKDAEYD